MSFALLNFDPPEQPDITMIKPSQWMTDSDASDAAWSEVHDDDADAADAAAVNGTRREETQQERATLARKENAAVAWMKGVVFVVLLFTCLLVATGVFWYTRNDQMNDFQTVFAADADKLLESFHMSVKRTLEAVDALGVTITSHALATGSSFPNVSLPDASVRFANSRILSSSVYVEYVAVVSDKDRAGWEAYFLENRHLYDEGLAIETEMRQSQDREFNISNAGRNLNAEMMMKFNDGLVNFSPDGAFAPAPPNSGPYLALYQVSPVTPIRAIINVNMLSHPTFGRAYQEVVRTGQATINAASNLNGEHMGPTGMVFNAMLAAGQFRHDTEAYVNDPVSSFGYPVFDSFDLKTRKVAALIGTTFFWKLYLKGILPPDTQGIVCVLENTMGQSFTYSVGGDKVVYLGEGDHHDPTYNHLVKSSDISSYMAQIMSPETKSYTSVRLNANFCSYTLRIYPSRDNENQHVNRDPAVIAAIIVLVFVFTSAIFVAYTVAVNRRQTVVMDRAVASSAIVSSLFPSQVRDQIYKESEVKPNPKNWPPGGEMGPNVSSEAAPLVRPIAELFEHTTIMFADLVGFTQWSASRNPVQVFDLLETLYQAFDAIAIRRKVFKVETIGDCYVAAAGIPMPQSDHAIIMARFSRDCMDKMSQLTAELAESLGDDTALLAMRIGLHSGSVTGGVLRGQKSRFQLFGDAMNTAARMESNGARGQIHASQQTADALCARGKSSWITPREDRIVAKGKGELQTYWVSPRSVASSFAGSALSSFVSEEGIHDDNSCCA